MNGRDRPRGPPSGEVPPSRDPRRPGDGRNGGFASPGDGLSRAEKFEDEKKRITQSCFAKKDTDGSLVESYITHVRITEDAAYPSTPPPPNSPPDNKKARVIMVSVRRSGRVRMHKARENNDGTFSIGKTWMLDDLSAILSYTGFMPSNPMEQQQKQWASNVGFVVTVGKPYYWHARSSKEKEFFIGSLVKIYRKYTGGKVPNLVGFDDRERALLVGTPASGTPAAKVPGPAPPRPHSPGSRSQSPYSGRVSSRDGPKRPPIDEQSLRAQRSRDQMGRPSTGQSGKAGTPPHMPPQNPPPAAPLDQPPPRAAERFAPENRQPKLPQIAPEPRKDLPPNLLAGSMSSSQLDRPSVDSEQAEARSSSSRDGKFVPPLRTQPSSSSSLHKDALRPQTPVSGPGDHRNVIPSPASSFGAKSPLNDSNTRLPAAVSTESLGNELTADVPPALKPVSPAASSTPPVAAEPPQVAAPEAARDAESNVTAPENISSPISPPGESSEPSAADDPNAHRPGLGPMIKKKQSKDVVGAFRKAANAYGAFKPRPGGAGERLLAAAKKQQAADDEPDGITGVVPAPSLRPGNDSPAETPTEAADKEPSFPPVTKEVPPPIVPPPQEPPAVEITQAAPEEPTIPTVEVHDDGPRDTSRAAVKVEEPQSRTPSPSPNRRKRRHADNTIKYCQALGIEPSVLESRGVDFDDILTDLGWNGRLSDEKKIEDLEADIRREIGRVEATSWLGNLEQQEGKIDQLARLIDKTVNECEEFDNLLTLYAHELNTLQDDVSYIETQSQGLQVQTANQKLLHNELQNLLNTLSISSSDLRPLKEASLSNPDGLRDTEIALSTLYKAMLMIDSNLRQNKRRLVDAAGDHGSVGVYADTEIGQMRAITEKKEEYRFQAQGFLHRLKQFMSIAYKVADQKRVDAAANGPKDPMKLDGEARDYGRRELWNFNALVLFAREVGGSDWHALMSLYEQQSKHPYQSEFRENSMAWKKAARKPTGEEQELLFTNQEKEKENEGITMAARRLTVKRGKTIKAAAGLRLGSGEKHPGKLESCEAFAGTLNETLTMISEEQNFIVHFFHLNSLSTTELPDLVASGRPQERRIPDFKAKQSHDPDRAMAKRVEQIMDELYSFWTADMQNLVDWAISADPLQGVGVLFSLERAMSEFDDTNQEFINKSLQKLHTRLTGLFHRFVDEQIRGIEDTKVKVNKRKGVISFMRVFPNFSTAIENMLAQPGGEFFDVRVSVNDAYERINRAMYESLKFIAKEAPGQATGGGGGASGDPEDKEVLNYHILLIENMNHYIEEVDVRGLPVLERWRERAQEDMQEHMRLYLDLVIRRPLGKLLEFIESAERLLEAGGNPTEIANRPGHSRSVAKKVLATYDAKEIKRGIELLKKRVEKHFGDADDPGLSRSLVVKVLRACEGRYEEAYERTQRVVQAVYEGQVSLEWRKEDAMAMFSSSK